MDSIKKIGKFLGLVKDTVSDSEIQKGIMSELKEQKEILEKSIDILINRIDVNEERYVEFSDITSQSIEKGFKAGEGVLTHVSDRHLKVQDKLVSELALQHAELSEVNSKLEVISKALDADGIETGKGKKTYADAIIQNEKGEILFLLRSSSSSFEPNTWGLPGGKVDPGETVEQGLIREVQEETGMTVTGCFPCHIKKFEMGESHYFHVFVKEDCSMVALDNEEHSNYAFMSIDEVEKRDGFLLDLKGTILETMKYFGPVRKGFDTLVKGLQEGEGSITEDQVKQTYQNWYNKVKKD